MDIYRQIILDHYKHPHNFGHLDKPSVVLTLFNSACGDKITMECMFEKKGKKSFVSDIRFSGEGCAVSKASASMLTDMIKGKSKKEVMHLGISEIKGLLGTELTPARTKCALLPLEVIQKCVLEGEHKGVV